MWVEMNMVSMSKLQIHPVTVEDLKEAFDMLLADPDDWFGHRFAEHGSESFDLAPSGEVVKILSTATFCECCGPESVQLWMGTIPFADAEACFREIREALGV